MLQLNAGGIQLADHAIRLLSSRCKIVNTTHRKPIKNAIQNVLTIMILYFVFVENAQLNISIFIHSNYQQINESQDNKTTACIITTETREFIST